MSTQRAGHSCTVLLFFSTERATNRCPISPVIDDFLAWAGTNGRTDGYKEEN